MSREYTLNDSLPREAVEGSYIYIYVGMRLSRIYTNIGWEFHQGRIYQIIQAPPSIVLARDVVENYLKHSVVFEKK